MNFDKLILGIFLVFTCFTAQAQYVDTLVEYYDFNWKKVNPSKEHHFYFRIAKKTETGYWYAKDYYSDNNALQMEAVFSDDSMNIKEGEVVYYHKNGQVSSKGKYYHGTRVGLWNSYYEDGKPQDSAYFKLNGMPYHKAYVWDYHGRIIRFGEFDMKGTGEGYQTDFFADSSISAFGKYTVGNLMDSVWTYYHPNGNKSLVKKYDSGTLKSYECFDINGVAMQGQCDTGYSPAMPEYKVYEFIAKNTRMPYQALEEGLRGTYIVMGYFTVDERGNLTDIDVSHMGRHEYFSDAALQVLRQLPKWQPCRHNNRSFPTGHSLPIIFRLE